MVAQWNTLVAIGTRDVLISTLTSVKRTGQSILRPKYRGPNAVIFGTLLINYKSILLDI